MLTRAHSHIGEDMDAGAAPVNRSGHVDQRVTRRYDSGCSGVTKISISRVTTLSRIIHTLALDKCDSINVHISMRS